MTREAICGSLQLHLILQHGDIVDIHRSHKVRPSDQ